MFGSKKDKEEKAKKKKIDIDGDKADTEDAPEEKNKTIDFEDRRSSTRSKTTREEVEGDSEADQEIENGEEDGETDDGKDKSTELLNQLQRLQAEFDNYRKRVQKERLESWNVAKRY